MRTRSEAANLAFHLVDRHLLEGRGEKTAVLCEDRRLCYRDLRGLVDRVAGGLAGLGVTRGQRVMVVLPDAPEFVAAYLGAIKLGAVAVPTSTALRPDDYRQRLEASGARVLIIEGSLWSRSRPAIAAGGWPGRVVVCGPASGEDGGGAVIGWDPWIAAQPPECPPAAVSPEDGAFWLWTSGSTGEAKAVPHRHRDWIQSAQDYGAGVLGIHEGDRTFSSSKLFHAYGLGNGLAFPLHAGATTILHPGRPTAATILEIAAATRPTLFFSVPTLYAAMLHHLEGHEGGGGAAGTIDLSSIRLAVSAAEPLPAEVFRRWRDRFGHPILDGIGSTEVLHIYISARARDIRPGSTGRPVPGYDVRIVTSEGRSAADGEKGELWVRGSSVAAHYWRRPALSRARWNGDWFRTGDMYECDPDGYYWYAGRTDDMLKVSGQWLSPIEVENTLVEHPAVLEAAVVGYRTGEGLVKPRAYVVLRDGWTPGPGLDATLQEFVRSRLEPYKYPREIRFLEALPKTATGKIERFRLRQETPESVPTPPCPGTGGSAA